MVVFLSGFFSKIRESKHYPQLIILLTFAVSLIIIRAVTILQREGFLPTQDASGLYIHHMVFGIIILIIAGYVGLSFWDNRKLRPWISAFFGFGAALTIDEFALWLFLDDVYWEEAGRISVDATLVVAALFLICYLVSAAHDHVWVKKVKRVGMKKVEIKSPVDFVD